MNANKMIIAKKIKEARKKKHWSQAKLAEEADLSTQFISQIETGAKNVSFSSIYRIAEALDLTVDSISGNKVEGSSPENSEVDEIFKGCSMYERQIMLELLKNVKKSLQDNSTLFDKVD